MISKKYRILLFIFVCVGVRCLFVYGSYKILKNDYNNLRLFMSFLGLLIGISFFNQYRNHKKIGGFGGPAYWHSFRLFHGITYVLFGILAFINVKRAYVILLIDVLVGLLVFTNNYFLKIY